jgi:hypothetical protein
MDAVSRDDGGSTSLWNDGNTAHIRMKPASQDQLLTTYHRESLKSKKSLVIPRIIRTPINSLCVQNEDIFNAIEKYWLHIGVVITVLLRVK